MHVLIIGGAGFIGSYLVRHLERSHQITIVDNLITGHLEGLPRSLQNNVITEDIVNVVSETFITPIDAIIHLAAIPSVHHSWQNIISIHHHNLSTTVKVIELCQKLSISKVIFASSAAVYGARDGNDAIAESTPCIPTSPYGLQKLASEQYLQLFAPRLKLQVIALRLFNVYGNKQQVNSKYSDVVSIFKQVMEQNKPIMIYGDGSQQRDFIYVQDVAIAFSQALTVSLDHGSFEAINLGTGQSSSLLDLITGLRCNFPQWHGKIQYYPIRSGDIHHSLANTTKAEQLLNIRPQFSLESGLAQLGVDSRS
ncbi:NAD-dependent epimerase/dehydratase family protein [Spirulina major]|uniref:NAD-dependent epimerase/dehydratase family protein n=1 Tax=Spirulina major TaxID=270636 RepID=UPI0009340B28|nr:NAD-dependent epimerase/dehydratase family protein [Spirulina major]